MTNDCKIHISGLWKRNMIYELTGINLFYFISFYSKKGLLGIEMCLGSILFI